MVSEDEDVLLLAEQLGLSESQASPGGRVALYSESTGRGSSNVGVGSSVIMGTGNRGQGPSGLVELGTLTGTTIRYKGESAELEIQAENTVTEPQGYTVDWSEDGSNFKSESKTIGPGNTTTYRARRTKDTTGTRSYQANDSNELDVTWMLIEAGRLGAFPRTVYTGADDPSTTLSLRVSVPSAEPDNKDVEVTFKENDTAFTSQTQTISPGDSHTFTTSVTKSEPDTFLYEADVTNRDTGLTGTTNEVAVTWSDDPAAAISLETLRVDDQILPTGDSTTLQVDAFNPTDDVTVDYRLQWLEDGSVIADQTQTVGPNEAKTYNINVSKSSTGVFIYRAEGFAKINRTREVDVAWFDIDVGELTASNAVKFLAEDDTSVELSLPVSNPSSSSHPVQVEFREDGGVIDTQSVDLSAGSSTTFTTTVDKSETGTFVYDARVTQEDLGVSGLSALTNSLTVQWVESGNDAAGVPVGGSVQNIEAQKTRDEDVSGAWGAYNGTTKQIEAYRITDGGQTVSIIYCDEDIDETGGDQKYDFDDCLFTFDKTNYDTGGYFKVNILHNENTNAGQDIYMGTNFNHSHGYVGPGDKDIEDGIDMGTWRFYDDGRVYDSDGNRDGSWK
jgi:plastocyanin